MLNLPLPFACGVTLKNRAVLAPLTNGQSPGGLLSEEEFQWLSARAHGGFGLVTSCATHVVKSGQGWDGQLGIYSDVQLPGWQKLSELGKQTDSVLIPQLFHGGFRCPSHLTGVQPVSASAFEMESKDFEAPRALTDEEIESLRLSFVQAAERAIRSGLLGVEIHGANGYLFTQFLSSFTNQRSDRYGGKLENRARFLLETVKAVRECIGPRKILGVRISPENTKLIPGIDMDEMLEVAAQLSSLGVDYISLSLWSARKTAEKYPKDPQTVIERFRRVIPSRTKLSVSGQIWTFEDAGRTFDLGADLVVVGAAAIANPDWPKLVQEKPQELAKFPLTRSQFKERSVSERFVKYLERWNFVAD